MRDNEIDLEMNDLKPFTFQSKYSYYGESIMSMGAYFRGHNLRQMRRYAYILWRVQMSFEMSLLYKRYFKPDANKVKMFKDIRKIWLMSQTVYKQLAQYTGDKGSGRHTGEKYGRFSKHHIQMSRDVKDTETIVKAMRHQYYAPSDKWGTNPLLADTPALIRKHAEPLGRLVDDMRLFISWGHWLTYLRDSEAENGEDSPLDLMNLNELIKAGIKFNEDWGKKMKSMKYDM